MLKMERQAFILHQVNLHNRVLSASLSSEIDVSEDTIRRDLQELADNGKLIKVHGGALSHSFTQSNRQTEKTYALNEKKIIGAKAAKLVANGMFILTGGGTTIIEMAKALPQELTATFVSGSIPAITEYMHHPNIEVIVLGDKLSKTSHITFGADVIEKLKLFTPDICMLGINALDLEQGITDNDWDVVQLKQQMIASSKKLVCLCISEKIKTIQPIHICNADKINILVTELDPGAEELKPFVDAGITVL